MKAFLPSILFLLCVLWQPAYSQKMNGEIFIPMDNRSEIWLKPRIDTLENQKEYSFKIRVSPQFKISEFLFEKGLAVQTDSVLMITANSNHYGGVDTATLRVIVTSLTGTRIYLFQKNFIVTVPEKMFPILHHPQIDIVMVNDKTRLERNESYPKSLFTAQQPFMAFYDNEVNMNKMDVTGVTVTLYKKEGKQYISKGDTISSEAVHEIRKIKHSTPIYIKVDAIKGHTRKSVWNRIIIDPE